MSAAEQDLKRDRLYFRVTERQRNVINEAARILAKDMTSFVLDAAMIEAQRTIADQSRFELSASAWAEFNAILERPTADVGSKPRLEKLFAEPSVLED